MEDPRLERRARCGSRCGPTVGGIILALLSGCQSMGPNWTGDRANFVAPPGATDEIRYQDETPAAIRDPRLPDLENALSEEASQQPERTGETVAEVRVKGNSRVPTHQILSAIRTRPGRYFDPDLLRQDIDQLWKMKTLRRVNGPVIQRTDNGVIVTIEVVEQAHVNKIRFVGNREITDWQLKRKIQVKEGEPLDIHEIRMSRQQLEDYYHEEGFRHTQVSIAEINETGDQDVVFIINEDQKERVLWVDFEGNEFASDARLRTFVQAKPTLLSSLKGFSIDRNKIDQDVARLTAYYRTFGFFNARIGREIIESKDSQWVRVRFVIDEGPRYVVNSVSFIGNQKFDASRLEEMVTLKPVEGTLPAFNSGEMKADVGALRDLYGSEGHVFADVQVEPRFLDEPGKLDLVYLIDEGKQFRVGKINVHIDGDPGITKRQVILNRMALQPGDVIDGRKIRTSERLLRSSQVFADGSPGSGPAPHIVVKPLESDLERMAEKETVHQ